MHLSRMHFTVGRLMVAVAIIAVILAGIFVLPGLLKRRSELLGVARHWRWRESDIRKAAEMVRSCPGGPGVIRDGRGGLCGSCFGATMSLKRELAATHAEVARSLRQAADILGSWSQRYERAASTPWRPMPPATASESAAMQALLNGDGPYIRKYFEVL